MSNHERGPERPQQPESHGRTRAEIAQREAVIAAEKLIEARLKAHELAARERAESPKGSRTERARQAIKRAWTERGDRKLARQAERAGMGPMYAALRDGGDSAPNPQGGELAVEAPEEEAIARAHAMLDQAPADVNVAPGLDEAREAVRNAPDSVPASVEVQMEGWRRLDRPEDEPTIAEAGTWSAEDPAGELGLMQEIDAIPEPSKLKQALWRATGQFRRK